MKIGLGCDHGGYALKKEINKFLNTNGYQVVDIGCHSEDSVDYPVYAKELCEQVINNNVEKGIIICGTGLGVSMVANRIVGIRAALCSESFSARMSREHNDANVLCLGGRIIGVSLAIEIVDIWLSAEFEGDRHARRIKMFDQSL
ncbi:MAG: ribose 5-phosphate isomerase B [Gammaproteobacteria bacterium]|nr:ribose 5-phosphate isomerase B [Gammaproteobacteria bacterium]